MRFITQEIDRPEMTSAYEEGIITAREKEIGEDFIWLWKHPKVIYMVSNATVSHIGEDYVKEIGYPINRSGVFNGTAKSVVIAGDDYSILCSIKNPTFNVKKVLYEDLWQEVAKRYGVKTFFSGNDVNVEGKDSKLLGMVYRENEGYTSAHCMFSATTPQVDLEKIFLLPGEAKMYNPSDRITDIEKETGKKPTKEEIVGMVREILADLDLEDSEISPEELEVVNSLEEKHLSTEWIRYATAK